MTKLRVAVVWRGDREARRMATPQNNRFSRVFEELAAIGIHAEPAVYDEEFANELRDQLLGVVQNRVTVETRNPFVGAALSIFGATRNQHFLNHVRIGVIPQ
jgi:hypothetical protein